MVNRFRSSLRMVGEHQTSNGGSFNVLNSNTQGGTRHCAPGRFRVSRGSRSDCFAAPAASANPIAAGSTKLTVDKKPAKKLKKNKIAVKRVKPAKVQKGSFVFPVTGGNLKPTDPSTGVIERFGGLKFQKGKRKLVAKKFVIKVANGVVVAKVGGGNVRLPDC